MSKTQRQRNKQTKKQRKQKSNKNITNNDYKKILKHYHKSIPATRTLIKINAEHILATKLCRCIKKVDKEHEARAIGICTKTIINNKGLTRGNFSCKGKLAIDLRKTRKNRN